MTAVLPEPGIFNGDVGVIKEIDLQQEFLTVQFDDKEADYDFTQLGELELAYAITVHKSQGSEYRAVVLALGAGRRTYSTGACCILPSPVQRNC